MFNILNSIRPVVSGLVFTSAVVSLTPAVWTISLLLRVSTSAATSISQTQQSHQASSTYSSIELELNSSSSSLSVSSAPSSPRTSLLSAEDGSIGQESDVAVNDTVAVGTVMPWLCSMEGEELIEEGEGEGESKPIDSPPSPSPSTSSSHSSHPPSSSASSHLGF